MGYFVFPQAWITAAISASVIAFGPLPGDPGPVTIHYTNLPGKYVGGTDPPNRIGIDKRGKWYWTKWRAQCVIAHEYGHLAGRKHVSNPRSIMHRQLHRSSCRSFMRRHR